MRLGNWVCSRVWARMPWLACGSQMTSFTHWSLAFHLVCDGLCAGGQAGGQASEVTCLFLPFPTACCDYQNLCYHVQPLCGFWGSKHRSSGQYSKCFHPRSHFCFFRRCLSSVLFVSVTGMLIDDRRDRTI